MYGRQVERKTLLSRLTLIPSMYGVVERIRGMLSSHVFEEIKSQPKSSLVKESDLQALDTTLSDLQSAFPHIYYKFFTVEEQQRFKDLQGDLRGLREVAYDVEDALDVAATELLMPDLPESDQMLLPLHVDDLRFSLRTMRGLLELMFGRVGAAVADNMSTFGLEEKPPAPSCAGFMLLNSTVESPFLELEDFIVGRDSEKERLINLIFSPPDQEHPNLLLITGAAGIGKTALGKLVCKDFRVSTGFDLVLWVSNVTLNSLDGGFTSSIQHTILKIIQSATATNATRQSELCPQTMDIESLKCRLSGILQAQKYLLILDDFKLLEIDGSPWLELVEIFKLGSTGSTVILITKVKHGGVKMEEIPLNPLPLVESWLLFS